MESFLVIILGAACLVSMARLAAVPRRFEMLVAALLVPVCLLGEERLAGSHLASAMRTLAGPEALGNWCTLIVVQELLVCVAWARRLSAQADGRRVSRWSWFALVPSVLLPVGVTALRLYLFQTMVGYDFRHLSVALAVCCPLLCLAVAEAFRRLEFRRLASLLLRLELVFLLMGIFLPVATQATLDEPAVRSPDWGQAAAVLGALAVCILLAMPLSRWLRRRRLKALALSTTRTHTPFP